MANLVDLAETLQCGVIDNVGRMNFPSRHPLNQSFRRGIISQADVSWRSFWPLFVIDALKGRVVCGGDPLIQGGQNLPPNS